MSSPLLIHVPKALAEAYDALWSHELALLAARGFEAPKTPDEIEDCFYTCDLLLQAREAGRDPLAGLTSWLVSWDDVSTWVGDAVDESVVEDISAESHADRYSEEMDSAQDLVALLWTRTCPDDGVWNMKLDPETDELPEDTDLFIRATPMDGEPFSLFVKRAAWRVGQVDAGLGLRLALHVAAAARKVMLIADDDLPQVLSALTPLPSLERLRAEAPIWWAAIDDYCQSLEAASLRMDALIERFMPKDTAVAGMPSMAMILSAPESAPIVLEANAQRAMQHQLFEALDAQPALLDRVMPYVRRFPLDFRTAFILFLIEEPYTTLDPEDDDLSERLSWRRMDPMIVDGAAWNYSRAILMSRARGMGRWGNPPALQLTLQVPPEAE